MEKVLEEGEPVRGLLDIPGIPLAKWYESRWAGKLHYTEEGLLAKGSSQFNALFKA